MTIPNMFTETNFVSTPSRWEQWILWVKLVMMWTRTPENSGDYYRLRKNRNLTDHVILTIVNDWVQSIFDLSIVYFIYQKKGSWTLSSCSIRYPIQDNYGGIKYQTIKKSLIGEKYGSFFGCQYNTLLPQNLRLFLKFVVWVGPDKSRNDHHAKSLMIRTFIVLRK